MKFKQALMGNSADYLSENWLLHGFLTHKVDIFTSAEAVRVIHAVRIGESCFEHLELLGFFVHIDHKLLRVKTNALVVITNVNASNLYCIDQKYLKLANFILCC